MGKRRKNRKVEPPSREERLTEQVSHLLGAKTITPMMVYEILLMGYLCYKPGLGLPHEVVWRSIVDGFKKHDRHYFTPGQMALLHGRDEPSEEDFESLKV